MSVFQFLLIAAVVIAAALVGKFMPGERSLALKRIYTILFVIAAVLAIIFPSILTIIANFFGIGRGTDLLLYVFIIASLMFAVASVRSKARSEARVTELARSVALIEARLLERQTQQPDDDGDESTP
ncbi:DUF2304 family protein [Leucobacter sp. GX24907]